VPVLCKTPTEHINTMCGQNVVSVLNLAVCIVTNELQSVGKATGRGMNDCGSNTRTIFFYNNHVWTGCNADPAIFEDFRGTKLSTFVVCSALPEWRKVQNVYWWNNKMKRHGNNYPKICNRIQFI